MFGCTLLSDSVSTAVIPLKLILSHLSQLWIIIVLLKTKTQLWFINWKVASLSLSPSPCHHSVLTSWKWAVMRINYLMAYPTVWSNQEMLNGISLRHCYFMCPHLLKWPCDELSKLQPLIETNSIQERFMKWKLQTHNFKIQTEHNVTKSLSQSLNSTGLFPTVPLLPFNPYVVLNGKTLALLADGLCVSFSIAFLLYITQFVV